MKWVLEDYAGLARLIEAANPWLQDGMALGPGLLTRRLRRALKMSQQDLARRAAVPRSLLERLEAGRDARIGSVKRALAALGCVPVLLPASLGLLGDLRAKAAERRRCDRELDRIFKKMDARRADVRSGAET